MFTLVNGIQSLVNWCYREDHLARKCTQIAIHAPSINPSYQITQALTDRVARLDIEKPDPDDYTPSTSAKTLWEASQLEHLMQLKLLQKHSILGPMCDGLIARQLTRTPLPLNQMTNEPIQITPKIATLAIKRALQHEASVAGTDITKFTLKTTENITRALQKIQEARDNALILFFGNLRENFDSDTLDALLAIEEQNPAEKAQNIRSWILDNQETLDRFEGIYITEKNLTSIPHEICFFSNLENLDLSDNQITSIPDSIGQLTNLQTLELYENRITAIPDSIGQLGQLKLLDLGSNKIPSIPDFIGKLGQLEGLGLYSNKIASIPDSISQLGQLKMFCLSSNKITSIPDSISQLRELEHLDLEHNDITSIPYSISQLRELKQLFLAHNRIDLEPDVRRLLPDCEVYRKATETLYGLPVLLPIHEL